MLRNGSCLAGSRTSWSAPRRAVPGGQLVGMYLQSSVLPKLLSKLAAHLTSTAAVTVCLLVRAFATVADQPTRYVHHADPAVIHTTVLVYRAHPPAQHDFAHKYDKLQLNRRPASGLHNRSRGRMIPLPIPYRDQSAAATLLCSSPRPPCGGAASPRTAVADAHAYELDLRHRKQSFSQTGTMSHSRVVASQGKATPRRQVP